ncbi:MAG: pentapeptide repeat-containing protein [Thermoproteota archaeon]
MKPGTLYRILNHLQKGLEKERLLDGIKLIDYLDKYYVENNAITVDNDLWYKPDNRLNGESWSLKDFLNDSTKGIIVIGAPQGFGKTLFLKKTVLELIEKIKAGERGSYIPILTSLEGLGSIEMLAPPGYRTWNSFLQNIQENNLKILLMLDGLERYRGCIHSLLRDLERYCLKYNIKTIMATRIDKEVFQNLNLEKYVRLLPFTEKQVNDFFKKYGVRLTFKDHESLGLSEEEISCPLVCWMLAVIQGKGEYGLRMDPHWKSEVNKALIHYLFAYRILRYGHCGSTGIPTELYSDAKRILRISAALEDPALENILREARRTRIRNIQKLGGILRTYLSIASPDVHLRKGRRLRFMYRGFREYFLAEYYYENILKGKRDLFTTSIPSRETIDFLQGLVMISKTNEAIAILSEIDKDARRFFGQVEKLVENTKKILEDEAFYLKKIKRSLSETHSAQEIRDYEQAWLYMWVSLCILQWIDPDISLNKGKLQQLIRLTSNFIPSYLKKLQKTELSRTDLQRVNLSAADLSHADLSGTNLFKADLSGADLSNADLSNANLAGANLSGANLSGCNLSGANLSHASLSMADLSVSNLSGANLSKADLSGANLPLANLTGTKLSRARLCEADLPGANLSHADLFKADLYMANFSRTNMFSANLSLANLSEASLAGADISGAIIYFTKTRGVEVNDDTNASKILLTPTPWVDEEEAFKVLSNLDPFLRGVILRDNPELNRIWDKYLYS